MRVLIEKSCLRHSYQGQQFPSMLAQGRQCLALPEGCRTLPTAKHRRRTWNNSLEEMWANRDRGVILAIWQQPTSSILPVSMLWCARFPAASRRRMQTPVLGLYVVSAADDVQAKHRGH